MYYDDNFGHWENMDEKTSDDEENSQDDSQDDVQQDPEDDHWDDYDWIDRKDFFETWSNRITESLSL